MTGGTLSAPNPEAYRPAGYINKVDGEALVARLNAGEAIEAYFQQTQTVETRITQNVFTETKGGDPKNVIMLGAHLDSVQAGAGINDDGSGTTLILEIARALEKFGVKNKVRFGWWGAEEVCANSVLKTGQITNIPLERTAGIQVLHPKSQHH